MANANKVMATIKDFLVKMKALDEAIPEDLAQDALEMVEGVKDALCEETEVKDEEVKEEVTETKDEETEEKLEAKVEDAMVNVLKKYGLIKDSSMKALDELEEKTEDDAMNEEEVTVDPEKINDSARAILRKVKPIIANMKDSKERKVMADSFAKLFKMGSSDNQYSTIQKMVNSASKAAMDEASIKKSAVDNDYNFGMDIAKKFNPHYKEG